MLLEAPFVGTGDIRYLLNPASRASKPAAVARWARGELSAGAAVPWVDRAGREAAVRRLSLATSRSASVAAAWQAMLDLQTPGRVFNVLNLDAARAARRADHRVARAYAAAAAEAERSEAAAVFLRETTGAEPDRRGPVMGSALPAGHGCGVWSPAAFEAAARLAEMAERARADIPMPGRPRGSYLGTVARVGPLTVGLDAEGGTSRAVERAVLARRGLDLIGASVTLLDEDLPDGGTATLAFPAGSSPPQPVIRPDPFDLTAEEAGRMSAADAEWLTRELLASQPRRPSA